VSNGLAILREPHVESGKRTMLYMALSLAIAAGGLFMGYLAVGVHPLEGQTLNAVLAGQVFGDSFFGGGWLKAGLLWTVLLSEAGLLVIAAQTGFIDGPRVMANMALDGWFPKRFSSLSERFTIQNSILIFSLGALLSLWFTKGSTDLLVLMYSINVFITFTLTQTSMASHFWKGRDTDRKWLRNLVIPAIGALLCGSILILMVYEKFTAGGWLTLVLTLGLIAACFAMRRHYRTVQKKVEMLDEQLLRLPLGENPTEAGLDPKDRTAIILVTGYSGVGVHTLFSSTHVFFPGYFKNVFFVSIGAVDSGSFKGSAALKDLEEKVRGDLEKYVALARKMGFPADYRMALSTDVVESSVELCLDIAKDFGRVVVFGGKLVFQKERWYHWFMHNQTAYSIQSRLQWEGIPMSILPVRVFE